MASLDFVLGLANGCYLACSLACGFVGQPLGDSDLLHLE